MKAKILCPALPTWKDTDSVRGLLDMARSLDAAQTYPYAEANHLSTWIEYVEWHIHFKKPTRKTAGRNTAILKLKILSLIMGEAVRMGYADANPLTSIKIRRDKPAKKSMAR